MFIKWRGNSIGYARKAYDDIVLCECIHFRSALKPIELQAAAFIRLIFICGHRLTLGPFPKPIRSVCVCESASR